jgi:hypothetical protein
MERFLVLLVLVGALLTAAVAVSSVAAPQGPAEANLWNWRKM